MHAFLILLVGQQSYHNVLSDFVFAKYNATFILDVTLRGQQRCFLLCDKNKGLRMPLLRLSWIKTTLEIQ